MRADDVDEDRVAVFVQVQHVVDVELRLRLPTGRSENHLSSFQRTIVELPMNRIGFLGTPCSWSRTSIFSMSLENRAAALNEGGTTRCTPAISVSSTSGAKCCG